ncbi:hypothetical protein SAMN05421763_11911 [[Luteovulum] sphaeroides subsp. megalophilum]|uniref:hypothetical protein n=1 Tax=Cereibacter sphaeroides TaxID=1063 RepID=UPI000B69AD08|nr:hypothetical protein [Cereibacter sphaeroides]SNT42999.1 hypothetical protein SAMN05421763_11911 [[Luteovulum] sphaeroides subsp. megalophilum]
MSDLRGPDQPGDAAGRDTDVGADLCVRQAEVGQLREHGAGIGGHQDPDPRTRRQVVRLRDRLSGAIDETLAAAFVPLIRGAVLFRFGIAAVVLTQPFMSLS